MIEFGCFTQPFEFDVSTQGSKQMVGWSSHRLSGRFFESSILLERFMVGFDVPSFTIDSRDLVSREGRIAGQQILNTRTTLLVYEDLLDEQEREIDTFPLDFHSGIRLGHGAGRLVTNAAIGDGHIGFNLGVVGSKPNAQNSQYIGRFSFRLLEFTVILRFKRPSKRVGKYNRFEIQSSHV